VHVNESMIKKYEEMLKTVSTKDKNEQIVDARPPKLFNGIFHPFIHL
jgi:3-mercaptopyruvate sulfurtransferase SseA